MDKGWRDLAPFDTKYSGTLCFVFLGGLLSYAWFNKAWVAEDAYISFRAIDNFLNGSGLVWNLGERVQVFSHPLWFFVVAAFHVLIPDIFIAVLIVSFIFLIATFVAAVYSFRERSADATAAGIVFVCLLISSRAFIDFSSSGLENALNGFLLALIWFCLQKGKTAGVNSLAVVVIAALLIANRMDQLLIVGPVLAWQMICYVRANQWAIKNLGILALCLAPVWGWMVFSTVYFGFPFPNTAYAKLATSAVRSDLLWQGYYYFKNVVLYDPVTMFVIFLGLLIVAWKATRNFTAWTGEILLGVGAILSLVYTAYIGGDFMAGRFMYSPFVVCALFIASETPGLGTRPRKILFASMLAGLFSLHFVFDNMPLVRDKNTDNLIDSHGIADERAVYFPYSSLKGWFSDDDGIYPNHGWVTFGRRISAQPESIHVFPNIGFMGYFVGRQYIVDNFGLSDPLLARIRSEGRPGHYFRALPDGYLKALESGDFSNLRPETAAFYEKIQRVTRGPLFDWQRFKDIYYLNVIQPILPSNTEATKLAVAQSVSLGKKHYSVCQRTTYEKFSFPKKNKHYWLASDNIIIEPGCSLEIIVDNKSQQIHSVQLSLDNNDEYQVVFVKNGKVLAEQVINPTYRGPGLNTYNFVLKKPVSADRILIRPFGGDDLFAVGHLEIN